MPAVDRVDLEARLERQRTFFCEAKGHFLVFASCSDGVVHPEVTIDLDGWPALVSEDLLEERAFDLGVSKMRSVKATAVSQQRLDDDSCPFPGWLQATSDWGVGATAALFTGGDVVFEESTSYTTAPLLQTWDDLDDLCFNPDNRWVRYDLDLWRGMESEYAEGIPVTPHLFRSPLDLANDLRGNRLFIDLYDHPEQVKRLLDWCTDSIIELDKLLRREIPLLRCAPGGAWGVALPSPGMLFLNGDPVDLISDEMAREFNTPYVEKLIDYAGALYFHHHSVGVSRARTVSAIRGLTVQEILQDPNGPRLVDCVDEKLIAASWETPIDFHVYLTDTPELDRVLEQLSHGRFIVRVEGETETDCRRLVERVRRWDWGA